MTKHIVWNCSPESSDRTLRSISWKSAPVSSDLCLLLCVLTQQGSCRLKVIISTGHLSDMSSVWQSYLLQTLEGFLYVTIAVFWTVGAVWRIRSRRLPFHTSCTQWEIISGKMFPSWKYYSLYERWQNVTQCFIYSSSYYACTVKVQFSWFRHLGSCIQLLLMSTYVHAFLRTTYSMLELFFWNGSCCYLSLEIIHLSLFSSLV